MTMIRAIVILVIVLTLGLGAAIAAHGVDFAEFVNLAPCRLADTRDLPGPYGGPVLAGGIPRDFTITGQCGIPANATAVSFNFTVTQPVAAGHLTVWPAGGAFPPVSTLNYIAADVANAAIVPLGAGGAISVQPLVATHLVIDVNGYYADLEEVAGANTAVGEGAMATLTVGVADGNTAVGFDALHFLSTGDFNTAVGRHALRGSVAGVTGNDNVAIGDSALSGATTGFSNTAVGSGALFNNSTGNSNVAIGSLALSATTGNSSVAIGNSALLNATTGNSNIALGANAGILVATGSSNIHIGHPGAAESDTIRIGSGQARTFIAAINGVTTGLAGTLTVLIDGAGQLGTADSSGRVKTDIQDLGDESRVLYQLRPVSFRYRSHPPGGPLEYGLIAEEVAEVYPDLVVRDATGAPQTVRYHLLPAMLLNELQRQHRQLDTQASRLAEQDERLRDQARLIDELTARLSRLEAKGTTAGH